MQFTLPSGATVELGAPDKLKAKHQRTVTRALSGGEDSRPGALILDLSDGVLGIIVQSWTLTGDDGKPLPIPSEDMDSLDELDIADYEALSSHPLVAEVTTKLMKLRAERVSVDDHADPHSPTEPSGESKPALREDASPKTSRTPPGTRQRSTSPSRSGGAGPRKK